MPNDLTVPVAGRRVPLAEIEARVQAATPGPWLKTHGCPFVVGLGMIPVALPPSCAEHDELPDAWVPPPSEEANMTLIAHAPADMAALCAAYRALHAACQNNADFRHASWCAIEKAYRQGTNMLVPCDCGLGDLRAALAALLHPTEEESSDG